VFFAQRQLAEAKQEVERERTKLSCTGEQLTTAQEHVAHLKEEVCSSIGSFCIHVFIIDSDSNVTGISGTCTGLLLMRGGGLARWYWHCTHW